ncbi:UPF0481 protein At3g47200-like [Carex rostrata]
MEEIQLEASLSKSSPLSEAPTVVDLEASLQRELDTLWDYENEAENFTIFRTPHNISQTKKNLFEPSVISIGPFHHGQKHLRAMEEQKMRFLRDFLSRRDHISLDRCIFEMKSLEMRTRRCYNEMFDDLDSNAFVKMMLLDGFFVIDYFSKWYGGRNMNEVGWNSNFIDRDLLLQENQIPFFIVDKLFELIGVNQDDRMIYVKYIAYKLLPNRSIIQDPRTETPYTRITNSLAGFPDPPAEIHHLVHLYYHYLVPNPGTPVVLSTKPFDHTTKFQTSCIAFSLSVALPNSTRNISSMVIPSATELKQKGLKFTRKSNPKHMLDISFEYGVLKIPTLEITDDTKPIFSNLIAFEQCKYGKENNPFTSFVYLLDNLVNTPNDVTILQECGIIENWLGSEEELTHFINQVTEGAGIGDDHYLAELFTEVNKYVESSWHRHRAKLIRDYFSSPWAIISLIAALILLVLTLVQSFFAVFAYFRPP